MASKEATIYILDVGATMRAKREGQGVTRLEETKGVLLKLLANKVKARPWHFKTAHCLDECEKIGPSKLTGPGL